MVPTYEEAMAELLDDSWTAGLVDSRRREHTLKVLLDQSRTPGFLDAFRENPKVAGHLAYLLQDEMGFANVTTIQTLRILRNACARRDASRSQCDRAAVSSYVLGMLSVIYPNERAGKKDGGEAGGDEHLLRRIKSTTGRLRKDFIMYAIQFLCNYCTGSEVRSSAVWKELFPDPFEQLLRISDDSTFAATSALMHNCIACKPVLVLEMLERWSDPEGGGWNTAAPGDAAATDREQEGAPTSSFIVTVCQLILGAGTLQLVWDTVSRKPYTSIAEQKPFLLALQSAVERLIADEEDQKRPWSCLISPKSILTIFRMLEAGSVADNAGLESIVIHTCMAIYRADMDVMPASLGAKLSGKLIPHLLGVVADQHADGHLVRLILTFLVLASKKNSHAFSQVVVPEASCATMLEYLQHPGEEEVSADVATILKALTVANKANQRALSTASTNIDASILERHGLVN